MKNLSKPELQAFVRNGFTSFIQGSLLALNPATQYLHNWHIDVIGAALEACRLGKLRRLIINVPPRSLKSHIASVAFPAFLLGHNPQAHVICASYAQDLADMLAGHFRRLMLSDWYQALFPTRSSSRRTALSDFATTVGGSRLATSVGGVLTGYGGDCIIIDDPLKPDEALSESQRARVNEWFDHTLSTRLNDKRTGSIIIVMQRLHEDDLVGHVLKQDDWKVLKFPAIAEEDEEHLIEDFRGSRTFTRRTGDALHPGREPLEVLNRLRKTLGEYHFAAQYQQNPSPLGGGMVKQQWFKKCAPYELPKTFDLVFQSWDTANKNTELSDYSVCTTWGVTNKHLYLLDVVRDRLDYPALKRAVKSQAAQFTPKNILIEDKASGTQLIQELIADGVSTATKYEPKMEKIMRMHSNTSMLENGLVHIPAEAHWLAEYLHEMEVFPKGRYDDQVDSTSQALDWYKNGQDDGLGWIAYYAAENGYRPKTPPTFKKLDWWTPAFDISDD